MVDDRVSEKCDSFWGVLSSGGFVRQIFLLFPSSIGMDLEPWISTTFEFLRIITSCVDLVEPKIQISEFKKDLCWLSSLPNGS